MTAGGDPSDPVFRDAGVAVGGFVLHDLGSAAAGEPWREVLPEGWVAPDLPGHGSAPAPRHGAYDPMGAATLARWALAGSGVVVGIGQNAHAATLVAAGGAASALVIVDGLWGPWDDERAAISAMYASLRAILADPQATAPPPPSGLDPRATHGYGVNMSAPFARRFWSAVTVPALAIETPSSPTPPAERAERASWFGGPTTLLELPSHEPEPIVEAILAWQP